NGIALDPAAGSVPEEILARLAGRVQIGEIEAVALGRGNGLRKPCRTARQEDAGEEDESRSQNDQAKKNEQSCCSPHGGLRKSSWSSETPGRSRIVACPPRVKPWPLCSAAAYFRAAALLSTFRHAYGFADAPTSLPSKGL